ncbi:hypothetical protein BX666DRAFT_1883655 [Dichotomocladium elegans]|nr:hypothetical protein BX666DRAFT_1883655 [Dichotomocladium elegans]
MTKLSAYEEERQKNIQRNLELLAQFELRQARDSLQQAPAQPQAKIPVKTPGIKKPAKRRQQPVISYPSRAGSRRLRGLAPVPIEIVDDDDHATGQERGEKRTSPTPSAASPTAGSTALDEELWDGKLLKADEYFDKETRDKAIRVDGHYSGWINPELIEKYQFEGSASEAWEKNGGGTFSFKDPLGTGKKKSGARFNAKAVAQQMFKKNPNMYFYRHNEPGVEQWTGDWTEEEKSIFLEVARKHGCGDKWGLFASYIPHRVGYQCSNFYRSELLPSGLIFDVNYEYTPSGRPIYVGNRNRGRQ